jgi:hypothetical protein
MDAEGMSELVFVAFFYQYSTSNDWVVADDADLVFFHISSK